MNQVIIDNTLLLVSLLSAFVVGKGLKGRKAGIILSTLLLFPVVLIFLNMWAHTVAVSVLNMRRIQAGTFQYDFTVYSHYLFGISFGLLSGISIHCARKYLTGQIRQRRNIFLLNLVTSLLFLPVGFINPLGFLPVLSSIFSSMVLLFDGSFRRRFLGTNQPKKKIILYAQQHGTDL